MNRLTLLFLTLILFASCTESSTEVVTDEKTEPNKAAITDGLPGPQLVTGAWMFIAAYKADPDALKELLPEGLTPHPNNHIVINMYTVPDPKQTSGFGAYTLTYLTVELEGHDSYVMDSDITYPGRYFVQYYNSSEKMRNFTNNIGIPAESGFTTTTVEEGKLTAELKVGENALITATANVGSELGSFGGGHLNYFGKITHGESSSIVKYPIPWNGGVVSTENVKINFNVSDEHPLAKIKPVSDPSWAIWTKGSFVYPQYQVVN